MRVSERFSRTGGGVGHFTRRLQPHEWELVYETTRKVRLLIDNSRNGCVLEYTGYKAHAALTATTTTWAGPIQGIVRVAAAILRDQKQAPSVMPQSSNAAAPEGYETVDYAVAQVIAKDGIPFKPGWVMVEPLV